MPPADEHSGLPEPPQAPRVPSTRTLHGVIDVDSYAWMRDHAAPALRDYLVAERAYYDAHSRRLAGLAGELYQEGNRADRRPVRGFGRMEPSGLCVSHQDS